VEQKKPHAHYDEFAEQFTSLMFDHWADILQVINRQSPRVAALLRVATPAGLKRMNGVYRSRRGALCSTRSCISRAIMKLWPAQSSCFVIAKPSSNFLTSSLSLRPNEQLNHEAADLSLDSSYVIK
jgi:hypothetical protein